MTAARALALVCLLVLAGCVSPFGPAETTPTPTASPTPTESPTPTPVAPESPTPTPPTETPAEEELPPGVTVDGVVNATELLRAHARALGFTGFVAVGNGTSVVSRNGFLVDVASTQRNRVAANGSVYLVTRAVTAGPLERDVHVWSNGSIEYERLREEGETTYNASDPKPVPVLTGNPLLAPYVRGGDYEVREVRNGSGGARETVLAANQIANVTELERVITDDAEEITGYTAVAVIDDGGRIRSLNASIEYVIGGQTETQTLDYKLVSIGEVEVERPAWVEEARNATATDATE